MRAGVLALTALLACEGGEETGRPPGGGGETGRPETGGGGETGDDTAAVEECGDAAGTLPDGLVELAWDDGTLGSSVARNPSWTIVDVPIADTPLFEGVRFELEHPARIHGFAVRWDHLPASGRRALTAGVYRDFGYNGFDFWHFEPLWEGSLCSDEVEEGEWATYVLDEPLEVDDPGLVYVAAYRDSEDDPALWFDGSLATDTDTWCDRFDECHSTWNFPELTVFTWKGTQYYYWPGLSYPWGYDYAVRLYVEYTEQVEPSSRVFQPVDGVEPGSRMSWGDFDGDGWDDLFTGGRLYRNLGGGAFEDVTDASGISAMGLTASGGVWGDYDSDGCLDLFVFAESGTASDALLRGDCAGGFSDVTAEAGILDEQSYNDCAGNGYTTSPSPAAAWWDVDADGWLDLYVANFVCWSDYSTYVDTVFHNRGDGTFEEWTASRGFVGDATSSRGANPADADGDGDVDLLVNNYHLQPNLWFDNQGDGTVEERGLDAGLAGAVDPYGWGYYGHTIGTAWGDIDDDGDLDAIEANLAHPRFYDFSNKTQVLVNDGTGLFEDIQGDWSEPEGAAGLRYQETHSVPVLADFDLDGHLDLAVSAVYDGRPTDFYWGRGDGTFELDSYHAGIDVENGWGMAAADFDHDGDLDLAARGVLYENTLAEGQKGNWIAFAPRLAAAGGRPALGATVRAEASDRVFVGVVDGGSGQGDQGPQRVHLGIGEREEIAAVEVDFPGWGTVRFAGPFPAGAAYVLREDGSWSTGW